MRAARVRCGASRKLNWKLRAVRGVKLHFRPAALYSDLARRRCEKVASVHHLEYFNSASLRWIEVYCSHLLSLLFFFELVK